MKIVVLDGDVINPGDISWAPLEKLGEVAIYGDTPEDLIVERAAGAEVLVTNKVPLRSGTLSRLPDLRMVAVLATGYDIIDTADAAAHGIPVCNVVAYGVDDVAQHAWALLLELCRSTGEHTASVRAGEWKDTWCYWKTTPVCLRGRTLGVIGFGSIGRRVGELGHAFGMSVLANCRTPRNPPSYSPFAFASTDQIFQQADVISLHCPLTDATRAIINAKALARMKPGAILINTARGPLLDEAAVAEALHSGKLGGLGVDVLANVAGIGVAANLADTDPADWDRVLGVNLTAIYHTCRAVLPGMVDAGGGTIVNVASVSGLVGVRDRAAYCASKAGVIGLTRSLAVMYRDAGIRTNAIAPGGTNTGISPDIDFEAHGPSAIMPYMAAMGRVAEPEEQAAAIAFLASDAASNINGVVLPVDNGWAAA